jgi:hypothetical protein
VSSPSRMTPLVPTVMRTALLAAAALVHPAVSSRLPFAAAPCLAGIVVLLVALVVLRALEQRRLAVLALGGLVVVSALGWDAVRGFGGGLRLRTGQMTKNLEESTSAGPVSLRPLGFEIGFEGVVGGRFRFVTRSGTGLSSFDLTPSEGTSIGGLRLGAPRTVPPGAALEVADSEAVVWVPVVREPGTGLAGLGLAILAVGAFVARRVS